MDYGVYADSAPATYAWQSDVTTSTNIYEGGDSGLPLQETIRIPLVKDIHFGFSYRIDGFPTGPMNLTGV